ncbi:hypothetical protein C8R47DRAFT_1165164 [Mycena vitilis]|nr:hypothetical protein C8R47DRAFT_1165164 [Mycena vitilis]
MFGLSIPAFRIYVAFLWIFAGFQAWDSLKKYVLAQPPDFCYFLPKIRILCCSELRIFIPRLRLRLASRLFYEHSKASGSWPSSAHAQPDQPSSAAAANRESRCSRLQALTVAAPRNIDIATSDGCHSNYLRPTQVSRDTSLVAIGILARPPSQYLIFSPAFATAVNDCAVSLM